VTSSERKQQDTIVDPAERLEALYRAILDSALDCIITMDAAGKVREFNLAAEHVFGFTRAEAIGRELAELIIPERMRDRHRQGLARYLKTGVGPVLGKRIEIAGLRRDGTEILVELAITTSELGGEPFFTAYLRDITKRKRDEEARQHFGAIVESSDDAIISTDLQGIITSWNAGAERLSGYKAEEVINKPVTIWIPSDRWNEESEFLERIHRSEHAEHYETVRQRKDGSLTNVSLTVSPIRNESGRIIGASKIARDITERVRNDRRRAAQYAVASLLVGSRGLAEASSAILQTIASIGDWVLSQMWLYDEAAQVLRCQSSWHAQSENLAGFADLSRGTQFKMGEGLPGRVWESNKPTWIYDVSVDSNFPRKGGAAEAKLRGGFAFPLFADQGANGVIEMFSYQVAQPDDDLLQLVAALGSQIGFFVERRRIEQELQREKESAEAANAAKDRFLAALSHELRTPLTPVLIWAADTADQPELPAEIRDGLQMVCRNVELEARLIDDLLDLTRITRGKLQLHLVSADAHELLRRAVEIVRGDIEHRHCKLTLSLEAAFHGVTVDPPRLQQVFWNVLRNAGKFASDFGEVSVRTYNVTSGSISIQISDSGVGIAPENLDKIFEPFEQAHSHREGLGLGLSISKAIVEMHGGSIQAHSEGLGKGATFVIELPTSKTAL
jgi:two-component system, chemotaxis family, CheB/CheR fusion protein